MHFVHFIQVWNDSSTCKYTSVYTYTFIYVCTQIYILCNTLGRARVLDNAGKHCVHFIKCNTTHPHINTYVFTHIHVYIYIHTYTRPWDARSRQQRQGLRTFHPDTLANDSARRWSQTPDPKRVGIDGLGRGRRGGKFFFNISSTDFLFKCQKKISASESSPAVACCWLGSDTLFRTVCIYIYIYVCMCIYIDVWHSIYRQYIISDTLFQYILCQGRSGGWGPHETS